MKTTYFLALLLVFASCQSKISMKEYPKTEKKEVIDTYFGVEVVDNYRWLEDDRSEETAQWVKQQNTVTFDFLNQIPIRAELKNRLEKVWNYEKLSAPFKRGDYTYFYKNDGLQNQYVIYREKGDEQEIFLDPNSFSDDGTVSLSSLSFSPDGSLAAYSISEGGSDWRSVIVIDALTKEIIEDTLVNIKFSGVSWKGNEGFYYSSYDKPKGSELSAKTDQHKLYYHKLGTSQKDDIVVFGANEKHRYVWGGVSDDGRFLTISASMSTSGNKLFIKDLNQENSPIINMVNNYDSDSYVLHNEGDLLYIVTNRNAPNKKVVTASFQNPQVEYWQEFIAETEQVLSPSYGGGYFFAHYMIDAISKVYQFDTEGQNLGELQLPGVGSSRGFSSKKEEKTLYYSFTNYHSPGVIYKYDVDSRESELYWQPSIDFNSSDFVSKQVFYTSKDGTQIPMIITHKKGLDYDGNNPTILYGYGGFNVSLTPSFSISKAVWLEQGGVYAVANLRGGGEYGKEWHIAGTQMQKQNVFDDFLAAAEYLIHNKFTSSDYLAIDGRSNGGLLVGATMTQRPDLMKVALPAVGVLDMLRYHTFTAGAGWAYDYGTSDDSKEMFEYLKGYSPVHNVKQGVSYPATMVLTADHDDRVVPAHSFKFIAELQDKHQGHNPVLIRIETNSGHGAGTPISKQIEETADIIAFTLYNMGVDEFKE
ncbi:MAG: S9 family peptidase [Flavobacteriales bacterium]|nr:S9 family peptidase [Flavobacteriales bacterium]|tara:strand:+ start:5310 stop:7415 length:2106 start_codon:yes stop_codon:yes gene_type:complete